MKKAATFLVAALMVGLLALPVYAANFYPVSVEEYTYGPFDELRIDKVYQLSRNDDPKDIPTEEFDRGGCHYVLRRTPRTTRRSSPWKPTPRTWR